MILIYSFLLLTLGSIRALVHARAAVLSRRYSALAQTVQQTLLAMGYRPGNANRVDACQLARQQYELGMLVKQRDQVEARHFAWQSWADRLGNWVNRLRQWKGQKLPYTMGALDIWLVLALIDHAGVGQYVSATQLVQAVSSWLSVN
jgi:hypothetical protein